ncbi:peptidoglycan recognition protein family protein [Cyanobium sp. FGCU-52]|nr:peptidoglycan recognition protein family protein [Cyanobium sp. FGCU52]
MNERLRPLLLACAGAGVLSLGGLVWLARDLVASPGNAEGRPSLLDILEEVRQGRPQQERPRRPAPPPPDERRWLTPLAGRCAAPDPALVQRMQALAATLEQRRMRVRIDPSNYGQRFQADTFGNPVDPTPRVVVLHETVFGLRSALNTFLTPHPRDEDQVSYHTLIGERGEIVETVAPEDRAFGAGNSAFDGRWVVTNPRVSGSINNFALHLSLETPVDGEDEEPAHSGYSEAQYDAMAVVLADWMRRFPIEPQQITTHRHVDLNGERADPRSFDWGKLGTRLQALGIRC